MRKKTCQMLIIVTYYTNLLQEFKKTQWIILKLCQNFHVNGDKP
jgi:hypothetical protein